MLKAPRLVRLDGVWPGLGGVLLLGGILAGFMGCGNPPQETTLQISTWGSAQEVAMLRHLLATFEARHPGIRVTLLHIPENYYQKLHLLIAGGMAPDVMMMNSSSFPVYAAHGVFRDLSPFLRQSPALRSGDFFPASLQAFTWRGRLQALPRDVSNLVVYYNRDALRQAGLPDPSPDWTWGDFLATARALTKDANHDGHPERFGVSFYTQPPLFWLPFVWSAGGELFRDGQLRLNEPAALAGLRFYADLRNRHHVAPRQAESGGTTMSELFLKQEVALMVNGRWSVPVLREQARFHWDVVPLPRGPAGSRVGIDASGYALAASTRHPQAAWQLVAFLLSRPSVEAVTRSGLIVPARRDVAASGVFLETRQPPAHGRFFVSVIPHGVPTQSHPRWNEIAEVLTLGLQPVWEGRQSPEAALQGITPAVNALLAEDTTP